MIRRIPWRLVADVVGTTALYYLLRAFGVSVYLALLISAVVPAVSVTVGLLRGRRVVGVPLFMTVMMLLSVAVSLINGSERFLLAKEGWLTAVVGLWFIGSVWAARPLPYLFSRPLLEGRFPPRVSMSWDLLWDKLPGFRRVWRVSAVLWGIGTLADAGARVVIAYALPVDVVPAVGTFLYLGTTLVLVIITNVYYFVSGLYDRRSRLYAPLLPRVAT